MDLSRTAPGSESEGMIERVSWMIKGRPFRVVALVSMIAAMSIIDLYLTLLYVTNTGMIEANPFARAMMEYRSPGILSAWKLATVVLSQGILLMIRDRRSAEIGAWLSCCVLVWLMVRWVGYIEVAEIDPTRVAQDESMHDPSWIMIEADAGVQNLIIP